MYRIAIGLDIGHGECAASYVPLLTKEGLPDSNSKIEKLHLEKDLFTIPSCFVYDQNGKVVYGRNSYKIDNVTPIVMEMGVRDVNELSDEDKKKVEMALRKRQLIKNFKKSPARWNEEFKNTGKSYKELMHDFIKAVFGAIIPLNQPLKDYSRSEIVLYVGCPSTPEWFNAENRTSYEELLRSATEVQEVHVIPESTAAVFSSIRNVGNIDLFKGVLVYDSGSSTFDETYMLIGKYKLERSWTLGASAIEVAIREKAMREELDADELCHVWAPDGIKQEMEVRETIKEAYYGTGAQVGTKDTGPTSKSIGYIKAGDDGRIRLKNQGGYPAAKKDMVDLMLDNGFMNDVVCHEKVQETVRNNAGEPQPPRSWREHCREFFKTSKEELDKHDLPYQTIILTGGGSNMDFVGEECHAIFETGIDNTVWPTIIRDVYPSFCVADGLCQVARNNLDKEPLVEEEKKKIPEKAKEVRHEFEKNLSEAITEVVFDVTVEVLNGISKSIRVGELKERIEISAKKRLQTEEWKRKMSEVNQGHSDMKGKKIMELSMDIIKNLYDEKIAQQFVAYTNRTEALNLNTVQNNNLGDITIPKQVFAANIVSNVVLGVFAVIGGVLLAIPGIQIVGAAAALAFFIGGEALANWIEKNPKFNLHYGWINNTRNSLKNDPEYVARFKKDNIKPQALETAKKIAEENFGENNKNLVQQMEDMLDKRIRMLALEEFEEVL